MRNIMFNYKEILIKFKHSKIRLLSNYNIKHEYFLILFMEE